MSQGTAVFSLCLHQEVLFSWGSCLNLWQEMKQCCQSLHFQTVQWIWTFYRKAWQWLHVLKCLWVFGCWWRWSFFDIFASVPVSCLSVPFLLISVEQNLWKVLPSLIRCCHCVENQSLYNIMIFWKRALQNSTPFTCPNLLTHFTVSIRLW